VDISSRSRSSSASSTLGEIIHPSFTSSLSSSTASDSSHFHKSQQQQHQSFSPTHFNTIGSASSNSTIKARRPGLATFMTNLTTSWGSAHGSAQDQSDQHTEEILSSSSLSSPISSLSPTTPNSISLAASPRMSPLLRSVSHTGAPSWTYNSSQEVIAGGRRGSADASATNESIVKQMHGSPPPMKRSRSNTVHACLKSHNALKAITERSRSATETLQTSLPVAGIPAGLSRKASMSLSLKHGAAFTKIHPYSNQAGKAPLGPPVPLSPKSPRSPLAAWVPHLQSGMLSPENDDLVNGNSIDQPPSRSIASPESNVPSTPLTPHYIAYIDHINVSYNPHSANGGECKKLLMRLERFKKRSSVDLSQLSAEAAAAMKSASTTTAASTTTSGNNTPRTPSTPSHMSRSSSASGGTTAGGLAAALKTGDSPKSANAPLHGHTFKVTAKIRNQADQNKVEVCLHSLNTLSERIEITQLRYVHSLLNSNRSSM
jgi:hypothetical protein